MAPKSLQSPAMPPQDRNGYTSNYSSPNAESAPDHKEFVMIPIRRIVSAAVVAAGLQVSGSLAAVAAPAPSPEVAYHAPSWWITAIIEGKQSTLQSGIPDIDRRLNVWLVGFGHGLGASCQISEFRALEAALQQQIAARPAMRSAAEDGARDGRRFAELKGCSSEDAASARRTIASMGSSVVADVAPPRRADVAPPRQDAVVREATVVNRSGTRILEVRMSETSDNNWGIDRLGSDVLDNGRAARIALAGSRSCTYDLQVAYVDRRIEERRNVDLCANAQVVFDGSEARTGRRAENDQPSGFDGPNRRSTP